MSEWVNVNDRLPDHSDIVKVLRENGDEIKAYYHSDKMEWLHRYCQFERSYFQSQKNGEWLYDVTHWK